MPVASSGSSWLIRKGNQTMQPTSCIAGGNHRDSMMDMPMDTRGMVIGKNE